MTIQKTFKPRDVEEPVDYWVNRPLASSIATWTPAAGMGNGPTYRGMSTSGGISSTSTGES